MNDPHDKIDDGALWASLDEDQGGEVEEMDWQLEAALDALEDA